MGHFANRHGSEQSSTPNKSITSQGRSYFRERHKKEIPASGGLLKSIADQGMKTVGNMIGNPLYGGSIGLPGSSMGAEAEEMRAGAVNNIVPFDKHPFLNVGANIISDPKSWLTGGSSVGREAVKQVGSSAKNTARSVFKPSKVYGEALDSAKGKVDFSKVISKFSDDPAVKKVLEKSGVIEKYGGDLMEEGGAVSNKLSKLDANQSQNLINDLKVGESKAFLSGDVVKSNKVGLSKFFSELSKAQNKASEGLSGAKKAYGFSKNVGKVAKTVGKGFVRGLPYGAGVTAGGKAIWDLLD